MADLVLTEKENLVAIADAIREKAGTTDLLTLDEMPVAIANMSGGDTSMEDGLLARNIEEYTNDHAETVGAYAFYYFSALKNVSLPAATNIGEKAFEECRSLDIASFPSVTSIGSRAFYYCKGLDSAYFPAATIVNSSAFYSCSALESVYFPVLVDISSGGFTGCSMLKSADFPLVTNIGSSAFSNCARLHTADFSRATNIGATAFSGCNSLTSLVLRGETLCALSNTSAFNNCYHILGKTNSTYNPSGAKDGYIYVPDALVDSYKAATNWSTYADQIKPLSEYAG